MSTASRTRVIGMSATRWRWTIKGQRRSWTIYKGVPVISVLFSIKNQEYFIHQYETKNCKLELKENHIQPYMKVVMELNSEGIHPLKWFFATFLFKPARKNRGEK